jgi:hypothetical protein
LEVLKSTGKLDPAVFPDETPETRQRLRDVIDAFENLDKELRQHIEHLRLTRWTQMAAALGLHAPPKPPT